MKGQNENREKKLGLLHIAVLLEYKETTTILPPLLFSPPLPPVLNSTPVIAFRNLQKRAFSSFDIFQSCVLASPRISRYRVHQHHPRARNGGKEERAKVSQSTEHSHAHFVTRDPGATPSGGGWTRRQAPVGNNNGEEEMEDKVWVWSWGSCIGRLVCGRLSDIIYWKFFPRTHPVISQTTSWGLKNFCTKKFYNILLLKHT